MRSDNRKALLRWAGSKRQHLGPIVEQVPHAFDRYIEPFAGSSCVFFHLQPQRALLADINPNLIQMYRTLRQYPKAVARALHAIPDTPQGFYRIRARSPQELSRVERTARFLFLNARAFNGLYRTNRQGQFNVPLGSRTARLLESSDLEHYAQLLRSADIQCQDFHLTLNGAQSGDFVYLDPPYNTTNRSTSGEYGYSVFTQADLPRLVTECRKAANRGAILLMHYADTSSIRNAFPGWHTRELVARNQIAARPSSRGAHTELLITNLHCLANS